VRLLSVALVAGTICLVGCEDPRTFTYPGNGVPFLSKNVEFNDLERELFEYSKGIATTASERGRLQFRGVDGFRFRSSKSLGGDELALEVDIKIQDGSCVLGVRGTRIRVQRQSLEIRDRGTVVFSSDALRVVCLGFTRTPSEGGVSIYTEGKLAEILSVPLADSVPVTVDLDGGCTGSLGPWVWIRGRE